MIIQNYVVLSIENMFVFSSRTASPVSLMKFSPDGEFFATAGQVSVFYHELVNLFLFRCKLVFARFVCLFIHIDKA